MGRGIIKIKDDYNCGPIFEEFNGIITEILDIISKGKPVELYGEKYIGIDIKQHAYLDLLDILSNFLEEKTNINDILKLKKYSLDCSYIKHALKGLDSFKDDEKLYEHFLKNLNHEFKGSKSHFTFIIPLNLKFSVEKYEDDLKKVLSQFQLEKCDPDRLDEFIVGKTDFKTADGTIIKRVMNVVEALDLVKKFSEIIKVDVDASNVNYARETAVSQVESFLGYLSYIDKKLSEQTYFGDFEDFSINNFRYGVLLTIENGKIVWPYKEKGETIADKLSEKFEKLSTETFEEVMRIYKDYLCKIKNESLNNILSKSFSLYYSACVESTLNYSFLKFWVLSEQMLKAPGAKTDHEILEIMKKFINKYLARRIDFLYDKRNGLVHKGEAEKISSNDRNLSKLVADLLIWDALLEMGDLKNKRQYNCHLLNFGAKKDKEKD